MPYLQLSYPTEIILHIISRMQSLHAQSLASFTDAKPYHLIMFTLDHEKRIIFIGILRLIYLMLFVLNYETGVNIIH